MLDANDIGILLAWYGAPCGCRCKHCSLNSGGRTTGVAFCRAMGIVRKYLEWKNALGRSAFSVDLAVGYSAEFSQLAQFLEFRKNHELGAWDFFPVNGIDVRRGRRLRRWFACVHAAGVRRLGLSFFGLEQSHDRWAGRAGAFSWLLMLAEEATAPGPGWRGGR